MLQGSVPVTAGTSYTVTVGSGGTASSVSFVNGGSGVNSVFGNISATGGAGGISYASGVLPTGGSGGGGTAITSGSAGIFGQGNPGGNGGLSGIAGQNQYAGGGGGAGTKGIDGIMGGSPYNYGGNGGAGIASAISGTVTAYAGGGGGAANSSRGIGGVGGGGAANTISNATAGTPNTGGGGGGQLTQPSGGTPTSGAGGSGIVIVSYPDIYAAAASTTGSPTVSTTGSGSISFNGSSLFLNYNAQTPFSMGTGNFTVEFWAYATGGLANYPSYIDFRGSNLLSTTFFIYNDNGILAFATRIGGVNTNSISYSLSTLNTWFHIAAVRISGSTKLYVNGTQVGSTYTDTNNYTVGTGAPYIGTNGNDGGFFTGYMSNIRVVKGVGVYTGTFTPSTIPLQATQPSGTNIAAITGTSTSLLLNTVSGGYTADSSTNSYSPTTAIASATPWNQSSPFATGLGYKNRVYTWTSSSGTITF